jgi:hypothetical protein
VQERWVEDGKFITSAGVSAGIDMAVALAARLTDEKTARTIQLILEYSPKPPFGDIDQTKVDAAAFMHETEEMFEKKLPEILAPKPELLRRCSPDPPRLRREVAILIRGSAVRREIEGTGLEHQVREIDQRIHLGHSQRCPRIIRATYPSNRPVASRSRSYRLVSGNGGNQDSRRTIQLS